MAFYNSGFPATYQPLYQPYQQPAFQQPVQPTQMPGANQMMTPPTIRAEIVQIDDEAAVDRFPVAGGTSQMFITRAEDKIIIKTMGQDGPMPLVVYEKRPPTPPAPKFDPAEYVRRDEVETLVGAALSAQIAAMRSKKEAAAE